MIKSGIVSAMIPETATPENRLIGIQRFILRMPSLSTTVSKVLEVCNQPSVSANDLNRVIALDPVLTGQVLKLINSAYYSLPNQISTLSRAIIMLGINTVKNLVLATSVLASFKPSKTIHSIPIDEFWAHSLGTGVISKAVARLIGVPVQEHEGYFVAGLMHDLGKFPMMACFPDLYDRAIDMAQSEQVSLCCTEKKLMGFDHSQIGRLIAAKWKLNDSMLKAIVNHHQPVNQGDDVQPLSDCVRLANVAAYYFRIGSAGEQAVELQQLSALAEHIHIPWAKLIGLQTKIEEEIENAKVFLKST